MAKYDWNDGKGKVHSIPLSRHRKNVRTQRKTKRRQADVDRVLAPKGYSDLVRDGNAAADLRYGPEERQLGLRAQQVPAWFGQYQANLAGIAQGVQQGYQKAIADVGTRQQQVNTADNTAREGLAKSMQKDAAVTGAQIDPSLFAQDVSAQTVRNQGQADFANLLGAHQQANNTYFGGIGVAGGAAQLAAQTQIGKDQTALAGDKGLFRQQYVSEARDREHTKSLERKAFDLDTYKATADAADDAADNRAARRKERRSNMEKDRQYRLDEKKFGADRAKDRYQRKNKLGPYKPGGPKEKDGNPNKKIGSNARIKEIIQRWETYKDLPYTPNNPDGTPGKARKPTPSEIKSRILGEKIDGVEITASELHRALVRRKKRRAKPKGASGYDKGNRPG